MILQSLVGFVLGAPLGRRLASRGVTASNALEGRQAIALAAILAAIVSAIGIYFRHRLGWMPITLGLYAEGWLMSATQVAAGFALGLLLTLEWPGRRDRQRLRGLVFGTTVLAVCVGLLWFRTSAIDDILRPSAVVDGGVVIQTTPFTCAPATIATLARLVLEDTTVTEGEVVGLTRTTRAGTTTLQEIRAMHTLGLSPRFAHQLTPDSLVALGRPALLHVREPISGRIIRHAVALLAVDAAQRTVTIGNPLYGRQVKRFDELEGYWIGEAVLVGTGAPPSF